MRYDVCASPGHPMSPSSHLVGFAVTSVALTDVSEPVNSLLKRTTVLAVLILGLWYPLASLSQTPRQSVPPQTSADDELSVALDAALKARGSGDSASVGRASQQVISLALVRVAKIRLDA